MDKPMSDLHFRLMSFWCRFRDFFVPRKNVLEEVGIQPGFHVLDYGCGPGSYVSAAVDMVGESGRLYALDIHPFAIKKVQKIVSKKRLTNVETISSNCNTGLPDESLDVALLYDILHDLSEPHSVLIELHRVLKPDGILSVNDHHMKKDDITSEVTKEGLFGVSAGGNKTLNFCKGAALTRAADVSG